MSDFDLEQLLGARQEEVPEIPWDAPDTGSYPPIAQPGSYEFVFHLREDKFHDELPEGFTTVKIQGHEYLQAVFDAEVLVRDEYKKLNWQRVNVFKTDRMNLSSYDSLARSLGLRYANTISDRIAAFQDASREGRRGRAKLEWRYFDKNNNQTTSTNPRLRKVKATGEKVRDNRWPRTVEGPFEQTIVDSQGTRVYGQAEFTDYFSAGAAEGAGA